MRNNLNRQTMAEGDLVIVTLQVKAVVRHQTDIPDELDDEGNVLSYKDGIMLDVPRQKIEYAGQEAYLLANSRKESSVFDFEGLNEQLKAANLFMDAAKRSGILGVHDDTPSNG